jgi:hypothetical protein
MRVLENGRAFFTLVEFEEYSLALRMNRAEHCQHYMAKTEFPQGEASKGYTSGTAPRN